MPQGAWGGGIWGANAQTASPAALKEGEEACTICHEHSLELCIIPCKHEFCGPCVNRLRKANVFKADAGIKCPLCRQYAEGFAPLRAGLADDSLVEANRAAQAAAVARLPAQKQTTPKDVRGPANLEAMSKWQCPHCGESHYHTYLKCTKCNTFKPSQAHNIVYKQDVLKCTHAEIRLLAEQKFYPGLRQAFVEAGLYPTDAGPCIGTPESVIAAVKKNGSPVKLHYVIRMLSEHGHVKVLVTEFFGNYTIQDLLGAAHAFRLAAAQLRAEGRTSQDALDKLVGKRDGCDSLVQLANGVTQAMPDGVIHAQGNFVVLKLLEVAEPIDCMSLAGALLPAALRITGEKNKKNKTFHGLEIMLKLVFKIGQVATQVPHMKASVQVVLDSLCTHYLKEPRQVAWHAHYHLGGQMLVEAAFVALPRENGAKLLNQIAEMGQDLLVRGGRGGLTTLICLASCNSSDSEVMYAVTTAICMLASSLENHFMTAMTKYYGQGGNFTDGSDLILKMLLILENGDEPDWVQTIVKDVMKKVDALQGCYRSARDKIPLMISMACIPPQTVHQYMQRVQSCFPEDEARQAQTIVAKRRRDLVKQPSCPQKAVNGPQTPQTAAPAPAMRFGDFEESAVAGGFASAPRAAPPSQAPRAQQPPPSAPRAHSSAPGQPQAQLQPAQPAPPSHMGAPPQQQQQQQQQQMGQPQRPPLIVTPPAPSRQPVSAPATQQPPGPILMKLSPRGIPVGARPINRPPYQPGAPAQPQSQGQPVNLAALLPHLMIGSQARPKQPAGPSQNGVHSTPPAGQAPQQGPPPAQAAQFAAQSTAQASALHPAPRQNASAPNGVHSAAMQRGESGQPVPPAKPVAASGHRHSASLAPASRAPAAQQARPSNPADSLMATPPPASAPAPTGGWVCKTCTYHHVGKEAEFLLCAICDSQRPAD